MGIIDARDQFERAASELKEHVIHGDHLTSGYAERLRTLAGKAHIHRGRLATLERDLGKVS